MLHILTLTWDNCEKLSRLHQSLVPNLQGLDYAWWIKDNHSKDDTVAKASSWGKRVHCIPYKDNQQNFSEGCNFLFKAAEPNDEDDILLLNNDIVFNDSTSISKMLSLINLDPEIGVVGGRLLYSGSNLLQHAGVIFDPSYKTPMHFRARQTSDANAEKNRYFQAITGATLITKAKYYRQICTTNKSGINGMDEKFRWAFDDVDLCLSISQKLDKKIVYCGETNIFHEESATLKKNNVHKLFLTGNLQHFFRKWKDKYLIDRDIYTKNPNHNLYAGIK
jgi:O-antigen biosynthesis protein